LFTPEVLITDIEAMFFLAGIAMTAYFSYRKGEKDSLNAHVQLTVNSMIQQGYIATDESGEEMYKVEDIVAEEIEEFCRKIEKSLPPDR